MAAVRKWLRSCQFTDPHSGTVALTIVSFRGIGTVLASPFRDGGPPAGLVRDAD